MTVGQTNINTLEYQNFIWEVFILKLENLFKKAYTWYCCGHTYVLIANIDALLMIICLVIPAIIIPKNQIIGYL